MQDDKNYFGPDRRRQPRNTCHTFGTVFLSAATCWQAREALIMDVSDNTIRIRTLPNLSETEFRIQLEESPDIYAANVQRAEQIGDYWEFTLILSNPIPNALGDRKVAYDFPRAMASQES